MTKRVALYLRVSTDRQTVENQRAALTEIARQRGWTITAEHADLRAANVDLFIAQQALHTRLRRADG